MQTRVSCITMFHLKKTRLHLQQCSLGNYYDIDYSLSIDDVCLCMYDCKICVELIIQMLQSFIKTNVILQSL